MIDDDDGDDNELLDDNESDGKRDIETVYDAPRSVMPRRGAHAEVELGNAPVDPFGDMPSNTVVDAVPAAIPPRKQARYQQEKQEFYRYRVVPLPPALQDPDPPVPDSPPYSPPPYTSDDEAEDSTDDFDIGGPSISSTNDVSTASQLHFDCPVDMLRVGQAIPPPESG
ncbi:hypothetical protein CYMTET_28594 [Cymbomonas tetramitiformis]|uniref:Uncharacterized protein n=1 Tax=Cymbomonas tetramitiformis TaxID=36881 RepID=A0AAE0FML7_9CHLO|nr:hypothetical protein CYMTET_28594 [Cymbomonas tetramitiformis]